MAKKITFETDVNAGGFSRGMKLIEAEAKAANGRMNRTTYEAAKYGVPLSRQQIQARAEYQAKEEYRAKRKAEVDAQRNAPVQGPDIYGTGRAKAAAAEVAKYQETLIKSSPGSFLNPRGSMAADQSAWNARLAAAKQQIQAQRNLQSSFAAPMPFNTGSGSHQFTKRDQMGGRSWGSASSMFVSVARDSAASLASGAPLLQVFAQQAPQVLQAVTMIGGGIMKWGLGLGAAAGALVGFHFATKSYFTLWAQGFDDLERIGASLDAKGQKLRALREEQKKENADSEKRAQEAADMNTAQVNASQDLANASSYVREAQAKTPEERQQMVINRLRAAESAAGRVKAESSKYEFVGIDAMRLKALQDQTDYKRAQLERINAENALADMKANKSVPSMSAGDALTSVGNFLGSGSGMINSIAQRQLDTQMKHLSVAEAHLKAYQRQIDSAPKAGSLTLEVPGS